MGDDGQMPDDDYLALSDEALQRQCRLETLRVSGPGGQNRNRRDTAVRLTHEPTGLIGQASEQRSQLRNREAALRRLRATIALGYRRPVVLEGYAPAEALEAILPGRAGGGRTRIGKKHRDYWPGVQALLDLFVAVEGSVSETAKRTGLTTGALSRFVLSDPRLVRAVNGWREAHGMRSLR
ncbi:MAG: Protein chain release factor B [Chloroflexi bacterium]|nr:MAG: Protein chain release factor B [Chloroflexota bacterium]